MNSVEAIDCVILCGGQGKRLKSVVSESQKVMAEVGGHPFLDLIIDHLISEGIKKIVLCTGYQAGEVEAYYEKNSKGISIIFSREEDPLGTGGGLKNAKEHINSNPFLVFNGDSYCPIELKGLLEFHAANKADASMVVSRVDQSEDYGGLTLDSDKITEFSEKTEKVEKWVNAGIYCFNSDIFALMPEAEKFSMEYDLFPALVDKNFVGYKVQDRFYDIGTPERYKDMQKKHKKRFKD